MSTARSLHHVAPADEKRQPVFIVRAKDGPNPQDWGTVGAAWDFKDGSPGYFVKLKSLPLQWDGTLIFLPPLSNDDEAPARQIDGEQ